MKIPIERIWYRIGVNSNHVCVNMTVKNKSFSTYRKSNSIGSKVSTINVGPYLLDPATELDFCLTQRRGFLTGGEG